MGGIPVLRAGACGAVLGGLMMLAAMPAHADDAAPAAASASASIDQAIEHEKSVRNSAIAGMVVGGVVIATGSIVSAVASGENADNRNNGNPTRHNVYVGDAVGLGVGLPILGLSAWLFADSQHKLNLLKRQRLAVTYSPDTHQPVLQLTFNY